MLDGPDAGHPATTASDVVERFAVTPRARRELTKWQNRSGQRHVVDHVNAHVATVAHRLDVEAVQDTCRATEHALGEARRKRSESVTAIRDWRPDFAMTHVYHYALETLGRCYTYQGFREFCDTDPIAHRMLWAPAEAAIQDAVAAGTAPSRAREAMRWRIGNSYYSWLRETYTITYLRAAGLDMRVHPLADAVFRVDGWLGRCVLVLYIKNKDFRDGTAGRKSAAADVLGDGFHYIEKRLDAPTTFGHVQLPSSRDLDALVEQLRAAPCS
jgi:hypothetical protein